MALSWLLDGGALNLLARTSPEGWPLLATADLAIVQESFDNAKVDATGKRQAIIEKGVVKTLDIDDGEEAFRILFGHLRPSSRTSKNLGEHQAIAILLASEKERIFITSDKGAAYQALLELGRGRVAHPCELWEFLHAAGRISDTVFSELVDRSTKPESLPQPWRLKSLPK